MFRKSLAVAALASIAMTGITMSSASAAKLEKVDMVKEGIDLTPVVVNANGNGYTGYATPSHRYILRVFAKGKGLNHVYWAAISNTKSAHPMVVGHPRFFSQLAPAGSNGWGVYKKSLSVHIGVDSTTWTTTPKQVCASNLAAQMAKGKSKSDVLKSEWKLTAHAAIYFIAAADSKARNKKRDHSFTSVDVGHKGVLYPVPVVCKKGI